MKKFIKLFLFMLLATSLFSGCTSTGVKTETKASKDLPTEISQEDWAESKKFVTLKTGIKMAYVEMGDPNGEIVILQHGMTDNSRSWSFVAPYFAKAGYHVYLPDLRGQGKSDEADGIYTTVTYATDLKAFFDAMNIDKAIVVGHSLGSFTMQNFMLMFPEKCSKVILVSSIPLRGIQNPTIMNTYGKFIAPLPDDGHLSDTFMDKWYESECLEENYKDVYDVFLKNLKKEAQDLSKKSWANIFQGLMCSTIEDIYQYYDKSIPILLIHGDKDTMTETKYQKELIDLLSIKEDSYVNYKNVGHNVQFEVPERCANDMLTWIKTGSLNKSESVNGNPHESKYLDDDMIKTLESIKRVDEAGALYEMECFHEYNASEFANEIMSTLDIDFGCSAFNTFNMNDEALTGRNYDYVHKDKNGNPTGINVMVKCNPKNGYKSIALCDAYWLDFKKQGFASGSFDDGKTDISSLAMVPLTCCDGMNEKGVTASILKLDIKGDEEAPFQVDKYKAFTTYSFLVRDILDKCQNVDEAIKLAKNLNMVEFLGFNCHIFVSDATGASRVFEWRDNKFYATDTNAVTNFYVGFDDGEDYYKDGILKEKCIVLANTEKEYKIGYGHGYHRFSGIVSALERFIDRTSDTYKTKMTEEDAKNILRVASQAPGTENTSMTQYSAIYNQATKSVDIYLLRDYDKKYTYKIQID